MTPTNLAEGQFDFRNKPAKGIPDDARTLENQPTNRMFPDYLNNKIEAVASNGRAVKSSMMTGDGTILS